MQKEERRARIRELLGSTLPGGVAGEAMQASFVVNVVVGSFSKKEWPVSR